MSKVRKRALTAWHDGTPARTQPAMQHSNKHAIYALYRMQWKVVRAAQLIVRAGCTGKSPRLVTMTVREAA